MGGMSAASLPTAPPMTKTGSSAREGILELKVRIGKSVLGQHHLVESMLIGLLANGNFLIESLPGLAKTRAVKTLAKNLAAELSRVQFTPDLLPSDVTAAEIYVQTANGGQHCPCHAWNFPRLFPIRRRNSIPSWPRPA